MPPAPSVSSAEDEEVAFKILNQDNLSISIIGHQILKPFDPEAHKAKPNVIVHPTRRITTNLEENKQKPFTQSSNNVNNINQNNKGFKKNTSNSHSNLCHNNSIDQFHITDLPNKQDLENFTKTLDSKLKRLQKEEIKQQKKTNSNQQDASRKPFVTTVKKGQFLEPPPEIATLVGLKVEEPKCLKKDPKEVRKLYAFASHPRVLSRTPPRNVHQTRCEAAAWAAAKLVGTVVGVRHEENSTRSSNQPYHRKYFKEKNATALEEQVDSNTTTSRLEQAQRRALARKRAKHQQISRPKRSYNSSAATSDFIRDKFDVKQLQKLLKDVERNDAATQTETEEEFDKSDVQIQCHPTDLFDFETEVQPIIDILVSKTIEEALIEVLEEEELYAIKEQQRKFLEYMNQKATELSQKNDQESTQEILKNMTKIVTQTYVPNLITSV